MIKRKINIFFILRLIGIILFVIVLIRSDLKSIYNILKGANLSYFLIGVIFSVVLLILKGLRWHIMNSAQKDWKLMVKSFGSFFESYALGIITPGRLGELMRTGHEKGKDNKANTLIRLISERGFDLGIFILIASLGLLFGSFIKPHEWIAFTILLFSIGLLILSYLLLNSTKTLNLVQSLLNKFISKKASINLSHKKYSGTSTFSILLLSVLSNLSYFIACFFLAGSVIFSIDIITLSGGVAISGLINLLPVSIMGLGTREITFITFFSSFDQSIVLAFSAIILFVFQIGGGVISMLTGQYFLYLDKKMNNLADKTDKL